MIICRYVNVHLKLDERVFFYGKAEIVNYIDSWPEFLPLLAIAWDGFIKDKLTMATMSDW